MRLIVAGSRSIVDYAVVAQAIDKAILEHGWNVTEIVSGTARGVDVLGERWGEAHGLVVTKMPADWTTHGKRAGFLRNADMARYAAAAQDGGALVAVWDGLSRGTQHMINLGRQHRLAVQVAMAVPTRAPSTGLFHPTS